jgi:hypothetical protein
MAWSKVMLTVGAAEAVFVCRTGISEAGRTSGCERSIVGTRTSAKRQVIIRLWAKDEIMLNINITFNIGTCITDCIFIVRETIIIFTKKLSAEINDFCDLQTKNVKYFHYIKFMFFVEVRVI